jgi:hypothetical protein
MTISRKRTHTVLALLTWVFTLAPAWLVAQDTVGIPEGWMDQIRWRSVGPANMSGRITAIAVNSKDPKNWWIASASGGLLKTINNGVTFEHQFDDQATVSIGDVQVFQGDPNIVWVGTGEANPRNSASWGNGVYRSDDGGETWKHLGLKETLHTGRIALHPTDSNIAYVGALGRLWGTNEERGLYKTTDGGETWEKILYIDEKTGVVDLQMHPTDPDTLLVATYERQRDGFDGNDPGKKNGPGSGLYMTRDGGKNFKKITEGLPTNHLGRIGLSWAKSDPNYVYAVIETEKTGQVPENAAFMGINGEDVEVGARITNVVDEGPAFKAGIKSGDIVIQVQDQPITSYRDLLSNIRRFEAGQSSKLQVSREGEIVDLEITFGKRPAPAAGGRGGRGSNPFDGGLGGQNENLQDQQGKNGFEFGGVFQSTDGGNTWKRINSLNPRPMYYSQIRVDPSDLNYVYVLGTRLYRSSNGGHTFTSDGAQGEVHVDHHALWIDPSDGRHILLGNDGGLYETYDRMANWDHHNQFVISQFYHVGVGPRRNYRIYGGLQDNGSWGGPSRVNNNRGPVNSDWFSVGGGDGFICLVDPEDPDQIYFESQNGAMGRINLRTGERGFIRPRPPQGIRYKFNWKTPFVLSPHNAKIHYSAGNYAFRSVSKGDRIESISARLTHTEQGSGSAISVAGTETGVVYVGTTDGWVWATRDDGVTWHNVFENPDETVVTRDARAAELKAANTKSSPEKDSEGKGDDAGASAETGAGDRQGNGEAGAEGNSASRGSRFREMLMSQDANENGKIERSEISGRMGPMFDRLDANKDGTLDQEEMAKIGQGGGRGERGGRSLPGGRPARESGDEEETGDDKDGDDKDGDTESKTPAEEPVSEPVEPAPEEREETDEQKGTETEKIENAATQDDPVSGQWNGRMISEGMGNRGPGQFTLILRLQADGSLRGSFESGQASGKIQQGQFSREKNTLNFTAETERSSLSFSAKLDDKKLDGNLEVNGGAFSIGFEAQRTGDAPSEEAEESKGPSDPLKTLVPGPRWVSSLEASRHQRGRCYMTLDGHRSNDNRPYVMVSEDYGQTWRNLQNNLPETAGSCRVVREDLFDPNILYLGCEFGLWVSLDRGNSWHRLNSNLPTVAIHEIAQHPLAGEIVAGTHGRGIWILDVTTLRQFKTEAYEADTHLFQPNTAIQWRSGREAGSSGTRRFVGENPASGAQIYYSLAEDAETVTLKITDITGNVLATLEGPTESGLHRVAWDLRQQRRGRGRGGRGGQVSTGTYLITLTVDDVESKQVLKVEADPDAASDSASLNLVEFWEEVAGSDSEEEGLSDDEGSNEF